MTAVYHFGPRTTLREIADCSAGGRRVLERAGIDYFADGESTLAQACDDLHLSVDRELEELERAYRVAHDPPIHGRARRSLHSLVLLAERMQDRTRELIYSIADTLELVERSPNRLATAPVAAAFRLLRKEVFSLMNNERRDLLVRLDALGAAESTRSPVGDLSERLRLAHEHHASIGASLKRLRSAIAACPGDVTLLSLRDQLRMLDRHLLHQVYLESHPLFRRAFEQIALHEAV